MRAFALAGAVAAASLALVASQACPAATPTPTPTPTITPFANRVNPSLLCPSACFGWNGVQQGPVSFALTTAASVNTTGGTTNVMTTNPSASSATWPSAGGWAAGMYTVTYSASDMCGTPHLATGTLDVRCNNPPTAMATSQSVTVKYGSEVLLSAVNSFDFDQVDYNKLNFYWCLISRPTSSGATYTTQYESVANYVRVPAGPLEGYALLKPDVTGVYTFNVVVSDGCNFVTTTLTVTATVTCCPHAAVATGANSITWTGGTGSTMTTTLSSTATTAYSCLPPDYVAAKPLGVYKNLYSPVMQDPMTNNTVTLNNLPDAFGSAAPSPAPVTGCTWPGANNFKPLANEEDGSCTCAPNSNSWDVNGAAGSYMRRADPANTAVVTKTPGNLTFGASAASSSNTTGTCGPQVNTTTFVTLMDDIRVDTTSGKITVNPLLARPSTSWDATITYNITKNAGVKYSNTNVTISNTAAGQTYCSITLPTAPTSADVTATITAPTGSNFTQCLGYYSFLLNSNSTDGVCPMSSDYIDLSVTCPYPAYVDILVDTDALWNGTSFVYAAYGNPSTTATDLSNAWVQIDARETTYKATGLAYSLAVTSMPVANTFFGAGPSGPALGGAIPLNPIESLRGNNLTYLSTTGGNITAAFLPTRAGQYEVTLSANDGCNAPAFDSVLVNTACLPIVNPVASINTASNLNPTLGSTGYTFNINVNGSYQDLGVASNLNQWLNYGLRVLSRPTLPFGDMGSVSYGTPAVTSFECQLGASWSMLTAPNWQPPLTTTPLSVPTTLGYTGAYTLGVTILDACASVPATLTVTAPACSAANSVSTVGYTGTAATYSLTWNGASFGASAFPAPTGTIPGTITYSYFLTSVPAGYNSSTVLQYPLSAGAVPPNTGAAYKCAAASTAWPAIGGISALRPVSAADPYAPLYSSVSAPAFIFNPPITGQYGLTFQAIGVCDANTSPLTVTAACNAAARFVCETDAGTPAGSCTSSGFSPNGFSQLTSTWNTADKHYAPAFFSVLVDAGSDAASANDRVTVQITLTPGTGAKASWWSAAYITQTLTFTVMLPDVPADILADLTQFPTLTTAVTTALTTAITTNAALNLVDAARLSFTNADLASKVGTYATIAPTTSLGVVLTPATCYTIGYGRAFTVTATFAILPPTYFRSFGTVAALTGTNPATIGYSRVIWPSLDFTPLYVFSATLQLPATLLSIATATATALQGSYAGAAIPATSTQTISTPAATANNYHYQINTANTATTGVFISTSFLPDVDGSYSADATVVDNCPSSANTPAKLSLSGLATGMLTVNVAAPQACAFTGINAQQYTTTFGTPASVSRTWANSTTKFGTQWYVAGYGPSYTNIASGSLSTVTFACYTNTGPCGSVPSGSSSSVGFPSTGVYGVSLAAFSLPSIANGATAQFTLSSTATTQPAPGAELHVGCASHPTSYTKATAITWFYTYDTTISAATTQLSLVLPHACVALSGTVDLVFAQFGSSGNNPAAVWTVANLDLWQAPAGYEAISANATLSGLFASTGSTYMLPYNQSAAAVAAQNLGIAVFAGTAGYSSNLPSQTITVTPTYTVSYAYPSWVQAATCASTGTATNSAQLSCQSYTPALGAVTVAFNASNNHFNSATLSVTGVGLWQYAMLNDFTFTFQVTGAPAGSVLDPKTAALSYLQASAKNAQATYLGYDSFGNILWSNVTSVCPATTTQNLWTHGLTATSAQLTTRSDSQYAQYIDYANAKVYLKNNAPPAVFPGSTLNTDYITYYIANAGMAAFIPDVSGTYTFSVTVNDMCNAPSTLTSTVNAQACTLTPAITVVGTPAITDNGSGRVQLKGSIGTPNFVMDSKILSISWAITSVPAGVTVIPTLYDTYDFYPSFVPPVAGAYQVTLTVNMGPGCMASVTSTVTVACSLTQMPTPSVSLTQINSVNGFARTSTGGSLVLAYQPNANSGAALNKDVITWLGEPTCPVSKSGFYLPATVQYTCPTTTYSVAVVSVFPPALVVAPGLQPVQLTVSVGGTVGIPAGLLNALYKRNPADNTAIVVTVGGMACTNPYISSMAAGQIVCWITVTSSFPASVPVVVSLLGVSSQDIKKNGAVTITSGPIVLAALPASAAAGLPTTGGTQVVLTGYGVAYDSWSLVNTATPFSLADTIVLVDGRPCTNLALVGASVPFVSQPQLSCTIPAGNGGVSLGVTIQYAFRSATTPYTLSYGTATTSYEFNYDAPVVTALTFSSNNTLGGYTAYATVKNLGLPYYTATGYAPAPVTSTPSSLPTGFYNDLSVSLGSFLPITTLSVTTPESNTTTAQIMFKVPSGCGSNLEVKITRRNVQSATPPAQGITFSYGVPMVKCVGQPYIDTTQAACTRVYIEGTNFGSSTAASQMNVTFWSPGGVTYRGQCDDVEYSSGNANYVRLSCRLPSTAVAGDVVTIANECGQSTVSASTAALPSSINLAGCASSAYQVSSGSAYNYAVNAPLAPATAVRTAGTTTVFIQQAGNWGDRVLSNGLFIGLVLPIIIAAVIVYAIVSMRASKQVGGGSAWASSASASNPAPGADKTVTKGATRVTMNPVSFAPAPPVSPAAAPGAVHDNL